ncbi:MAG TPA: MBL fold metallo-hydrolase [Vicinamibacterales bacterium]|nr:MBL fold metallo-hydrolase [Vicinamibacterales bacterium]
MKRVTILGTLIAIGGLSIAGMAAQPQKKAPPEPHVDNISVEKVKDNLFVLRGGGGNTAAFVTAKGVTLVDTKNPGWGQPLLDKVKTLTDKPVTMVINTHTHYDHNSGNVEMPASVEIVAHATTAKLMTQMNPVVGLGSTPNVFKDNPGKGMPKRTFTDKLTLGSGADRIDLYYFGPAHTGGDAFVAFPALRVMHAGDVFARKGLPIMDKNNGGSGVEYANTVRKAVKGVANIDTIINGHTPANTTPADMMQFADYVADFVAHVQAAKKAGKTAAQAVAEWKNPDKYTGFAAVNAEQATAYAQVIFDETR